jgi:SAM-dependent methyltransferase
MAAHEPHDPHHPCLRPYREAVARYGAGFEATLWGTREGQQRRFDVMIDFAGFEGCTILDAGCGPGDFAVRLQERRVAFARYVGIDALAEMIDHARQRGLIRCEFHAMNVLDPAALTLCPADFICFSGTLNTMEQATAQALVQRAFEAAARGVVFNFLSTRHHSCWGGRDLGAAHRFDPVDWLNWSLTLSSRVSFTQDYLDGHDATIMIRHDESATAEA